MAQILIIDDDPFTQLVLKKPLQAQGYAVLAALNGEDGIVQARQHQPALIICDWQMPGMDGLEVCRRIKADPAASQNVLYFAHVTIGSGRSRSRVRYRRR